MLHYLYFECISAGKLCSQTSQTLPMCILNKSLLKLNNHDNSTGNVISFWKTTSRKYLIFKTVASV